ncbi:MAG: NIL domain-containing protein [Planctomycetes bacterium]|nr:NIL domain-containing protein [Planctomycetota bacterium]
MAMRKYFCTFPQHLISEPIISYTLGARFGVIPNIRSASITDTLALVAVEIEGDDEAIVRSVAYLKERGVRVEEMADDPPTAAKAGDLRK